MTPAASTATAPDGPAPHPTARDGADAGSLGGVGGGGQRGPAALATDPAASTRSARTRGATSVP